MLPEVAPPIPRLVKDWTTSGRRVTMSSARCRSLLRLGDVRPDLGLDADRHPAEVLGGDHLGRHRGQDDERRGEEGEGADRG